MSGILEAERIIRAHQQRAPVQTLDIAAALGLKVYHVKDWDDDISGLIRKDDKLGGPSGYAIFVNGNHPKVRRRFTTAHEIAHFALHKSLIGDGITDDGLYRSKLSGTIETQANRMAADILMPWHLIREATDNGLSTVAELARHFEVSRSTMSIQLGVPYETNKADAA
ncbi:ImmA/IrrE family metallo-endopeptidase [Caenibius sp. WL]|uniref:ImmA/IrrE family metallo-endopeptidase n=1 Tax=Caenibius sp. WL TaxID=2872646 RepID=UPI001C994FE1|nr:ImmA/IrrE family metallo-endopeptidase [Caenibius sp. WL]QZP08287.1 ImmA/IrrE family metallo-endopeptidase [Caenibius sp. WL]